MEPLKFFALAELFPRYSVEGMVKVYAALDAIPGYLVRMKSESKRDASLRIGKWWHRDKEIDLVILNERKKENVFLR